MSTKLMSQQNNERITHSYIEAHPEWFFVYGDDCTRKAYRGQAAVAGICDNAAPVSTKFFDCERNAAYYTDELLKEHHVPRLMDEIARIKEKAGDRKIVLFPRIGCGGAELPTRAPKFYKILVEELNKLIT